MHFYNKIETVHARAEDGTKKLIMDSWRNPTVEMLKDIDWVFTEKIDGTNISVCWDGHEITFHGRTEKANIPEFLENKLREMFDNSDAEELFEQKFGEREVILFGEGYGNRIQSVGKHYIPDGVSFILFDVMIGGNYQSRDTVEDVARCFGIDVVPIVLTGTIKDAEGFIMTHPASTIGDCEMEGVVGRPKYELQDRCGNRIIVKIKWRDYKWLCET